MDRNNRKKCIYLRTQIESKSLSKTSAITCPTRQPNEPPLLRHKTERAIDQHRNALLPLSPNPNSANNKYARALRYSASPNGRAAVTPAQRLHPALETTARLASALDTRRRINIRALIRKFAKILAARTSPRRHRRR